MDIILKQDVERLGYKNDIVSVKSGFANNYLIPNGLAVLVTASRLKEHEEMMRQRAHKEEQIKNEAGKALKKLKEMKLKVGAKVGENGKIFGSVNSIQLADAITALGVEVDRKHVSIKDEPIKKVGTYEAEIKLHKDICEVIKFEVVEE